MRSVAEYSHCGSVLFAFEHTVVACPTCRATPDLVLTHPVPVAPAKPRCIVVRPTGRPFRAYTSGCLLHVGVTDSRGAAYHFDERGLHERDKWAEALCVPVTHPALTDAQWDAELASHVTIERLRRGTPYHSLANNCYDFALRFLNLLAYGGRADWTKEQLAQRLIARPVEALEAFLYVHAEVERKGTCTARPPPPRTRYTCDDCGAKDLQPSDHWRCVECVDFDLCAACVARGHPHRLLAETAQHSCDACGAAVRMGAWVRCVECADTDLCPACATQQPGSHRSTHRTTRL